MKRRAPTRSTVISAAQAMARRQLRGLSVTEDGKVVGIGAWATS